MSNTDLPSPAELKFNPDTAQLKAAYKLGRDSVLAHFESEAAKNTSLGLTRSQFRTWVAHCGNHFIKDRERGAIEQILFAASIMAGDYDVGKVPTPLAYTEDGPSHISSPGSSLSVLYRSGYKKGIAHFIEIAKKLNEEENKYENLIVWLEAIWAKQSGKESDPYIGRDCSTPTDHQEAYNSGFEDASEYVLCEAEALLDAELCFYNFFSWAKVVATLNTHDERSETKIYKRIGTDWDLVSKKAEEGFLQLLPVAGLGRQEQTTELDLTSPYGSDSWISMADFNKAKNKAIPDRANDSRWLRDGETWMAYHRAPSPRDVASIAVVNKYDGVYILERLRILENQNIVKHLETIDEFIKRYNPVSLTINRNGVGEPVFERAYNIHQKHGRNDIVGICMTSQKSLSVATTLRDLFKTELVCIPSSSDRSPIEMNGTSFWALAIATHAARFSGGDSMADKVLCNVIGDRDTIPIIPTEEPDARPRGGYGTERLL